MIPSIARAAKRRRHAARYRYPENDTARLADEMRRFTDLRFTHAPIKIGSASHDEDLRRIETAAMQLPSSSNLTVDAMNSYTEATAVAAARALERYRLWWFEDICDPFDLRTQTNVARAYEGAIAAGEASFSMSEARLLHLYDGLRKDRGHLFSLHVVAALGLDRAEVTLPMASVSIVDTSHCRKHLASGSNCTRRYRVGSTLRRRAIRAFTQCDWVSCSRSLNKDGRDRLRVRCYRTDRDWRRTLRPVRSSPPW